MIPHPNEQIRGACISRVCDAEVTHCVISFVGRESNVALIVVIVRKAPSGKTPDQPDTVRNSFSEREPGELASLELIVPRVAG